MAHEVICFAVKSREMWVTVACAGRSGMHLVIHRDSLCRLLGVRSSSRNLSTDRLRRSFLVLGGRWKVWCRHQLHRLRLIEVLRRKVERTGTQLKCRCPEVYHDILRRGFVQLDLDSSRHAVSICDCDHVLVKRDVQGGD